MDYFHVGQFVVSDELPREAYRFFTPFHTDYPSRRTDTLSQKLQTTLWSATDLDHSRACPPANLIKQPLCLGCEFLRLTLEPFLFCLPVAKEILIRLRHHLPTIVMRPAQTFLADRTRFASPNAWTPQGAMLGSAVGEVNEDIAPD